MNMRRKERQITDDKVIDAVIMQCDCCRLGFLDEEGVYIVPLSFGFETIDNGGEAAEGNSRVFYFHGAREGRKALCIACSIENNVEVAFELDCAHAIKRGETACAHSAYYKCVMGTGKISHIEENSCKKHALNLIMEHETGKGDYDFPSPMLSRVSVFSLTVTQISCKANLPCGSAIAASSKLQPAVPNPR